MFWFPNFFAPCGRTSSVADARFLSWCLQRVYSQPGIWVLQQQTTGIINLKYRDYLRSVLKLAPLREQKLISVVLDTIDEGIRNTEQIIAKLGQVKQGLLHDLLTRGIDDNGELRDPTRHPEQFKDSALGRILTELGAVDWQDLLGTSRSGIAKNSNRVTRNASLFNYLRVANVQDGFVDLVGHRPRSMSSA